MSASSQKRDGAKPAPSRARRILRRLFRCARTTLLIVALLVVVAGFFLNKVGLPEFVKKRVVAQLRAKGWEVEFSRLRLRWYRGLVAEDLQMRRANNQPGPLLFLESAECRFNRDAYRHLKLEVTTVLLSGGRVAVPFARTNQPQTWLQLDDAGDRKSVV